MCRCRCINTPNCIYYPFNMKMYIPVRDYFYMFLSTPKMPQSLLYHNTLNKRIAFSRFIHNGSGLFISTKLQAMVFFVVL